MFNRKQFRSTKIFSIKKLLSCVFLVLFFQITNFSSVKAEELKIGVYPSFFKDTINQGFEKTFQLTVVNNSNNVNNKDAKQVSIHLEVNDIGLDLTKYEGLSEEDRKKIFASSWVTFDKNDFLLDSGKSTKVQVTVRVPEDSDLGERVVGVYASSSFANTSQSVGVQTLVVPKIQIPLIFSVLDKQGGDINLDVGAEIEDFTMSDRSDSNSLSDLIKGMLIPSHSWKTNIDTLLHKPLKISYKLNGQNNIIYDIIKTKKVPLKEVLSSSTLTATRYISVSEDITSNLVLNVDNVSFKDNEVLIKMGDKVLSLKSQNASVITDIRNQVNILANDTKPTLDWLLTTIKVSSIDSTDDINLYANCTIVNTGNVTLVPTGVIEVYDENNAFVTKETYNYTLIKPNTSGNLYATLLYDPIKMRNGNYTVKSTIVPYTNAKPEISMTQIKISNIRAYILMGVAIFYLGILSLITFSLRKLFKKHLQNKAKEKLKRKQEYTQYVKDIKNELDE